MESVPHLPHNVLLCELRLQHVQGIPEGWQGVQELHGGVHIARVAQVAQAGRGTSHLQGGGGEAATRTPRGVDINV